jgi:hypothetical protein
MKYTMLALLMAFASAESLSSPQDSISPQALNSPQDFSYGMALIAPSAAAGYRVTLPLQVYQGVAREDLDDIRVFNAKGEIVPYALERPAPRPQKNSADVALPLFQLHGEARTVPDALRVTIGSPGATVQLQTSGNFSGSAANTATPISGYIVDARALERAITSLQVAWPDEAGDFGARLLVEASDDFSSWRLIVASAPIANLHADGRQLVRNRVELPATLAKFWRLSWMGSAPGIVLKSVAVELAETLVPAGTATLEIAGAGAGSERKEFEFDLGAALPVERIDLLLPEVNSVASIELLSRKTPREPWHHVLGGDFYRINSSDGEIQNAPIGVSMNRDRFWLARVSRPSGGIHADPIRLQVAWTPAEVRFLAQGEGPFQLGYGNATATSASTDLMSLPRSVNFERATLGEQRVFAGAPRPANANAFPMKRVVLWAALGLSVLMLGWMAYRLSAEVKV